MAIPPEFKTGIKGLAAGTAVSAATTKLPAAIFAKALGTGAAKASLSAVPAHIGLNYAVANRMRKGLNLRGRLPGLAMLTAGATLGGPASAGIGTLFGLPLVFAPEVTRGLTRLGLYHGLTGKVLPPLAQTIPMSIMSPEFLSGYGFAYFLGDKLRRLPARERLLQFRKLKAAIANMPNTRKTPVIGELADALKDVRDSSILHPDKFGPSGSITKLIAKTKRLNIPADVSEAEAALRKKRLGQYAKAGVGLHALATAPKLLTDPLAAFAFLHHLLNAWRLGVYLEGKSGPLLLRNALLGLGGKPVQFMPEVPKNIKSFAEKAELAAGSGFGRTFISGVGPDFREAAYALYADAKRNPKAFDRFVRRLAHVMSVAPRNETEKSIATMAKVLSISPRQAISHARYLGADTDTVIKLLEPASAADKTGRVANYLIRYNLGLPPGTTIPTTKEIGLRLLDRRAGS